MPHESILDVSQIDQDQVAVSRDEIYQVIPHRFEFQQLNGIFFIDEEKRVMAGYREVRGDEFWVRGHIPGRPIFPGVLMIETAAQLVGYFASSHFPDKGFLGFSGVDGVKFRGQVVPGDRLVMVGRMIEVKPRRCKGLVQGFVNGKQVFEGTITGMWL